MRQNWSRLGRGWLALLMTGVLLAMVPAWGADDPDVGKSTTPTLSNDWENGHYGMVADANARAKEIQIVLLGDSITARWTRTPGQQMYDERMAPHGAINLGISADGTQHVLWRLQHGVLDQLHPKMVLLMIGTNNMGAEPDAVAYGVWQIVKQIRDTHPETRVLVQAIFPRKMANDSEQTIAKVQMVNQFLAKLDDGKMVKYVDFGHVFLTADGSLNKSWFTDGIHPEVPAAFTAWADAIQPIVDAWLNTPPVMGVPAPPAPVAVPNDLRPSTPDTRNDWLRDEKKVAAQAARGNCDLLFLGGTVMTIWGRDQALFKKEYGQYRPLNAAVWASRTEHILWQIDNGGLDGVQPKLVVVQVQDQLQNTSARGVAAGMAAIAARLRAKLPNAKILLLGGFPRGESPRDPRRTKIAEYNALLKEHADGKTIFFLDLSQGFLNADGTMDKGVSPSQEAFNVKMLERWTELWRGTIADLMK